MKKGHYWKVGMKVKHKQTGETGEITRILHPDNKSLFWVKFPSFFRVECRPEDLKKI